MVTGATIHQWLQEPQLLQQKDTLSLETLHASYPYFTPATLLLHFFKSGAGRNIPLEELCAHNPVVYHYWNIASKWESPKATSRLKSIPWQEMEDVLLEHEKDNKVSKDYFESQGIKVSEEILDNKNTTQIEDNTDQSLMVVMSFTEWLHFLQKKTKAEQDEEAEKRALKAQWQKQKMAEAIEEENEEIPAQVFEMAVNSIAREDGILSESMALVYAKQGKHAEAIDIYKKLSLNNPEKSVYFAEKIENLQKEI